MFTRRTFIQSVALAALPLHRLDIPDPQVSTPVPAPWDTGHSQKQNPPRGLNAEKNTVQVVRTSPVLAPGFAAILIHNCYDHSVMVRSVFGTVAASGGEFEREQYAYGIPTVVLPPNEYWIGQVMVHEDIEVGTELATTWTVNEWLPGDLLQEPTILLGTFTSEQRQQQSTPVPASPDEWPFLYLDRSGRTNDDRVQFQQVFFDAEGAICGYTAMDDAKSGDGISRQEPHAHPDGDPYPIGETTDSWIAQWSVGAPWLKSEWPVE